MIQFFSSQTLFHKIQEPTKKYLVENYEVSTNKINKFQILDRLIPKKFIIFFSNPDFNCRCQTHTSSTTICGSRISSNTCYHRSVIIPCPEEYYSIQKYFCQILPVSYHIKFFSVNFFVYCKYFYY